MPSSMVRQTSQAICRKPRTCCKSMPAFISRRRLVGCESSCLDMAATAGPAALQSSIRPASSLGVWLSQATAASTVAGTVPVNLGTPLDQSPLEDSMSPPLQSDGCNADTKVLGVRSSNEPQFITPFLACAKARDPTADDVDPPRAKLHTTCSLKASQLDLPVSCGNSEGNTMERELHDVPTSKSRCFKMG